MKFSNYQNQKNAYQLQIHKSQNSIHYHKKSFQNARKFYQMYFISCYRQQIKYIFQIVAFKNPLYLYIFFFFQMIQKQQKSKIIDYYNIKFKNRINQYHQSTNFDQLILNQYNQTPTKKENSFLLFFFYFYRNINFFDSPLNQKISIKFLPIYENLQLIQKQIKQLACSINYSKGKIWIILNTLKIHLNTYTIYQSTLLSCNKKKLSHKLLGILK
ncbi:transmembrane protein, putative (macronuclear) [Tetrahymena thermophila SB210]|uniref:Transmembrane protein, putative n=1 Tax=Tetrahymena thermophila (strain SB210) TaxID=312017 RepID=W7X0M0_TETTS|nr:transmembrane protein, putative [Tetrahymena thermophila SB210]EWS72690.1 transmembrane protein, putative [Tetrahymena thermophila SB210]|eukprot:XP_012654766.1 transmembrane protein, putative [Tetrahymena thermophila SB210]